MIRTRARSALLVTSLALLGTTALSTAMVAAPAWAQAADPAAPVAPAAATPVAPVPLAPVAPVAPAPLVAPTPAGAQTGYVRRITVEGNERLEAATVISYLPIAVGDTVDA